MPKLLLVLSIICATSLANEWQPNQEFEEESVNTRKLLGFFGGTSLETKRLTQEFLLANRQKSVGAANLVLICYVTSK